MAGAAEVHWALARQGRLRARVRGTRTWWVHLLALFLTADRWGSDPAMHGPETVGLGF